MTGTCQNAQGATTCGRPTDAVICIPCRAEIARALQDLARELGHGQHLHVASGLVGRGARSGTTTSSGHSDGIGATLLIGLRAFGQTCARWHAAARDYQATPVRGGHDLADQVAVEARSLAYAVDDLARHPEAVYAHQELTRDAARLERMLNPPSTDDERWVAHLRRQVEDGRQAWLTVALILDRWRVLRSADPNVGPAPSRRTLERWAAAGDVATFTPPGQAQLLQVGSVVDRASKRTHHTDTTSRAHGTEPVDRLIARVRNERGCPA